MTNISTILLICFLLSFIGAGKKAASTCCISRLQLPRSQWQMQQEKGQVYILFMSDDNELEVRRHCHQSSEACVSIVRDTTLCIEPQGLKQYIKSFTNSVEFSRMRTKHWTKTGSQKDPGSWTQTISFVECLLESALRWLSRLVGNLCLKVVVVGAKQVQGDRRHRELPLSGTSLNLCFWWANGKSDENIF